MNELLLTEMLEKYLRGELSEAERIQLDELRKNNAEVDQLVVENLFFLQQLETFGNTKRLKASIDETVSKLIVEGFITPENPVKTARIVNLWNRYKKTIAVAASIATIVSVLSALAVSSLSDKKIDNIKPLVEKLKEQDNKYKSLEKKIEKINKNALAPNSVEKPRLESKFRATGFIIDVNNNYLVTNAHVLNEATHKIIVENNKGEQFSAVSVYSNINNDLAIIQITDPSFTKLAPTPYAIKKTNSELGDAIFMLGYPKQEIVYGEGYISAKNGYQMDSAFCQLSTLANEGNSGSPVINKNGELVGIISSKEANLEGVVFAVKSANIFSAINEINTNDKNHKINITSKPSLKKADRISQIKKVQDYIFMIKGN